ncbi:MAG: relaxase domain-containing protein [Bifidobacteriaceae bacterium]|nr:relaxase domain-containing protein [Bifidobacteriaceae bacterium]
MSAGDGYRYLLKTVVVGDGDRDLATPLTRYYAQTGTPPGRWAGSAVTKLGAGELGAGDQVTERHLELLIGQGRDPVSGSALGRAFPRYESKRERVQKRVGALGRHLQRGERAARIAAIEQEEAERPARHACAGYDFTFSVPKSVSTLWAVADAGTQALIADAHHAAVGEVLEFMERQVACTRVGAASRDGSVVQADVTGLVAAAFDHYDSRAGDPHLHTHMVIANRVQATADHGWRSLDGRPLHAATVALSECHQAVLMDRLSRMFGVGWDTRIRGRHRNPSWDIAGVDEALIAEFSTRARGIDVRAGRLVEEYAAKHGRQPSNRMILKLRQQATLETRPDKQIRSLADLTERRRQRAAWVLGRDAGTWAGRLAGGPRQSVLRADDVLLDLVDGIGQTVLTSVGERRSTWRRWNLWAEAARQTMGWRFASAADREQVTVMICDAAERRSVRLTPPDVAVPAEFTRADGSTRFRPHHGTLYTSEALIQAEEHLLELSRRLDGPVVDIGAVEAAASRREQDGLALSDDQAEALASVTASGRVVDVLVGPAGAGKTTALAALRAAGEAGHGLGSVIGLVPSATAAAVLADDLGIGTENTAKWLADHDHKGAAFLEGQLVIVDEASLAGTFTLDRIASCAAGAGAKLLLTGDWAQLSAVDAGGAFNLLVHDRADAPKLTDVHRFANEWEKFASLRLRRGESDVIDEYETHGRVTAGTLDSMIEAAYQAWMADLAAGLHSVLIADDHGTVSELNDRARFDRVASGDVDVADAVTLAGDVIASRGDLVITRRNDRRLVAGKTGWVRNGDRWVVTRVHDDRSVTVRRAGYRAGASVVLPAAYAAADLDLGYAVTAHRSQGVTADTAHAVVTSKTARENLYVAATRGRTSNRLWVATDHPDDTADMPVQPGQAPSARDVLVSVFRSQSAESSAHQAAVDEHERWNRIDHLVAMHQTVRTAATRERWAALVNRCGLAEDHVRQALASEMFSPLCASLDRLEAIGHNPESVLPRLIAARPLSQADDPAREVCRRVDAVNDAPQNRHRPIRRRPRVLGLVPQAVGPMRDDMRRALTELENRIRSRARELTDRAAANREPWLAALGPRPGDQRAARRWDEVAMAVAAYREHLDVTGPSPLGDQTSSSSQRQHAARLKAMMAHLHGLPKSTAVASVSAGASYSLTL